MADPTQSIRYTLDRVERIGVGADGVDADDVVRALTTAAGELEVLRVQVAELEAERARLRHIMLGLTIIEKMEARQDADAEEDRIRADERASAERDIVAHFAAKRGDAMDDLLDDVRSSRYPKLPEAPKCRG
jgi:hypothetical protein